MTSNDVRLQCANLISFQKRDYDGNATYIAIDYKVLNNLISVTLTIILKVNGGSVVPSYQHNLAPLNSGIKVSLSWPFCTNTAVDSYRTDAHNLTNTETTYYITFESMVSFNGTLYIYKWNLSVTPWFPKYLPSWHQALSRTIIKKLPNCKLWHKCTN